MVEAVNPVQANTDALKAQLQAKIDAAKKAAEAASQQQQLGALSHYEKHILPHSLDESLIGGVQTRAKTLSPSELDKMHKLEADVLSNKDSHFSSMNPAKQAQRVNYLRSEHALGPVKSEIGTMGLSAETQQFKSGSFKVKGVNGKFVQHTDGSVIHYLGNKNAQAVMKGAEVEKHLGKSLSQARGEVGALGKLRSALFKNKVAGKMGKAGLYVGVPVAVLGGLAYLSHRGKKEFSARDHMHDPLEPLPMAASPDMVAGPADGRTPGEWQARVAAMRGGQQVAGPINPAQSVGDAQDLGAVTTR